MRTADAFQVPYGAYILLNRYLERSGTRNKRVHVEAVPVRSVHPLRRRTGHRVGSHSHKNYTAVRYNFSLAILLFLWLQRSSLRGGEKEVKMSSEQIKRDNKDKYDAHEENDDFRLSDDGEGEEERDFKVPVLQIPTKRQDGGESISNPFFSEPSASEDADSDRIRASHRSMPPPPPVPISGRPRFLSGSSDDDGMEGAPSSYQPQHFISFYPSFPTSPGNTSISSWDSPAMAKRKVLLQWPVPVRRNRIDRLARYETSGRIITATPSREFSPSRREYEYYHSPNNESEEVGQDSDDYRDIRRLQSKEGSNSSSTRVGDAARRRRSDSSLTDEDRRSFQDHDSIFRFLKSSFSPNRNVKSKGHQPNQPKLDHSNSPSVNDSLNMTFSDSEPDESNKISISRTKMDAEAHNSADDEKTVQRPLRVRGLARPIHQRTRSGDGAAAKLVRHGSDWKGMEQDRIPLPDVEDDEDDNDEETGLLKGPRPQRSHRSFRLQPEPHARKDRSSLKEGFGNQQKVYGPFIPTNRRVQNQQNARDEKSAQPKRQYDSKKAWLMQMANLDVSSNSEHGGNMDNPLGLVPNFSANSSIPAIRRHQGEDREEVASQSTGSGTMPIGPNRVSFGEKGINAVDLDKLEKLAEEKRGFQRVIRHYNETSPFANFGKAAARTPKSSFRPPLLSLEHDPKAVRTFLCPRCGTRQREFFSVTDAPEMMRGPASYLAAYFTIYVIASLFIFGLEEGWDPLDCIYFAVVTLTTAGELSLNGYCYVVLYLTRSIGLGDNVPTSDANKVICSIFIFFGVSCIGLLLGSYIAGILDERARIDRKSKLADSCPNCARIRTLNEVVENIPQPFGLQRTSFSGHRHQSERTAAANHAQFHPAVQIMPREHHPHRHRHHRESEHPPKKTSPSPSTGSLSLSGGSVEFRTPSPVERKSFVGVDFSKGDAISGCNYPSSPFIQTSSPSSRDELLGSPVTRQILDRQKHTRHHSFDLNEDKARRPNGRRKGDEFKTPMSIAENAPLRSFNRSNSRYGSVESLYTMSETHRSGTESDDECSDDASTSSEYSLEEVFDENLTKLKTAKYVFLTLRQALVNSMTIIAAGSLGFYFIEKWSLIDCWYFTTVFLTTVGYGDIVPITKGGKLFATVCKCNLRLFRRLERK